MLRVFRWAKWAVIGGVGLAIVGGLIFGKDLVSYVSSSGRMIQTAVKDSIPVEFEIRRARDLLDELVPEVKANLRLVAEEEVEVADLEREIAENERSMAEEKEKILALRTAVDSRQVSYPFGGRTYTRTEVVGELERRFDAYRMSEKLLDGKKSLLENRKRSLQAAMDQLEKTRLARVELAAQIDNLEGEFRLVQAQSAGSDLSLDNSKLAQTRKLLDDLRKRLDVTRRVLAKEAKFVEFIPVETEDPQGLVDKIDSHFGRPATAEAPVGRSL